VRGAFLRGVRAVVRFHLPLACRYGLVSDWGLRILAATGLAVGAVFGMAGTFTPSASLRGLAWGIDGVGLVMAAALLTLVFYREGQDLVASGFLVFALGEGIILSSAAMDLVASIPSFGAGTSLWARPADRRRHGTCVEWLSAHRGVSVWGGLWAVGYA
jgi:hypothetical protein